MNFWITKEILLPFFLPLSYNGHKYLFNYNFSSGLPYACTLKGLVFLKAKVDLHE